MIFSFTLCPRLGLASSLRRNRSACLTISSQSEPHSNSCIGHFGIPSTDSLRSDPSLVRAIRMGLRFRILWFKPSVPLPAQSDWVGVKQSRAFHPSFAFNLEDSMLLGSTCPDFGISDPPLPLHMKIRTANFYYGGFKHYWRASSCASPTASAQIAFPSISHGFII